MNFGFRQKIQIQSQIQIQSLTKIQIQIQSLTTKNLVDCQGEDPQI